MSHAPSERPKFISTNDLSREEWLIARTKWGIGSSESQILVNTSRYNRFTPYMLWELKTGRRQPTDFHSRHTLRGIRMEQVVAEMWAEETGLRVQRDNKIRIHPTLPLIANIDRLIIDPEKPTPGILEIKTTLSRVAKEWQTGIPTDFFSQVQHQMIVTGYGWGEIAVLLIDTWDFLRIPLTMDAEYCTRHAKECTEWWEKHVVRDEPPDFEVPDLERHQFQPGMVAEATLDDIAACTELFHVKIQKKSIEAQETELENQIKKRIGDGEALLTDGKILATWKNSAPGIMFNEKRFKEENAEMYEKYVETRAGSRRFYLKHKPSTEA